MSDEKPKNKHYETEFSFSFSALGDKLQNALGSLSEEPETAYFEEKLGEETEARVSVGSGVGKLHIHAGDDASLLAKVETRHVGKMHFSAEPDGKGKKLKIENQVIKSGIRGMIGSIGKRDLFMDVALSASLPLDVRIDNGVGEALLDLRGLTVSNFKLEGGVGPAIVYLPEGDYKTSIEGGVGPVTLNLPQATGHKVSVDGGVGPMSINLADYSDITLDVDGGMGPVNINVPAGTPLMIEYESGIGPFSKPAELVQKQKNVWQTEGYDLAERSVYLKLEGGVGPCRVTFVDGDPAANEEKSKRKTDE